MPLPKIDIDALIARYPALAFLKSPAFERLTVDKKEFLLGCVEDAIFWIEQEGCSDTNEGFKFLAAAFGLSKAKEEADAKGLEGKDREKFLRVAQDLFTQFSPFDNKPKPGKHTENKS